MNLLHRWYCGSSRWAALVEGALLPWALEGVALGAELLELGPGPGVTTEVLRRRVARLTAVELDAALAARLARRLPRPGVRVVRGTAPPCRSVTAPSKRPPCSPCSITSRRWRCRTGCWPRCAAACDPVDCWSAPTRCRVSAFGSTTWPTRWWWWTRTASRAGWRRPASRSRWWTRAGRIRFRARRPQAQTPR
jgi:hypothetical protein